MDRAKSLVIGYATLSARDAIHAAVIQAHGIARIMSFDQGYDVIPGVVRVRD